MSTPRPPAALTPACDTPVSSPALSFAVELDSNLWGSAYEISIEGFGQSMHAEEKGEYNEVR